MIVDREGKIFENRRKCEERRVKNTKVAEERRKTSRRKDDKKTKWNYGKVKYIHNKKQVPSIGACFLRISMDISNIHFCYRHNSSILRLR